MNNRFVTNMRVCLIRTGKVLPFIVCFVVFVSYAEDIFALCFERYIEFNDGVYLYKPISWFIGNYFKYDLVSLLVLVVTSCAIETCIHNKIACAYLLLNLAEKSFFDFELEPSVIYIICIANVFVAGYLTIKGITVLTKTK